MAEAAAINCQRRDVKTKGFLNQLKKRSMVPGVVYGNEMKPINISAEAKQLGKVFQVHGTRALFSLGIEGEHVPLMVVVREIQRHPVNGQLTHIDFFQVNMKEKMTSTVGIHITGEEELLARDAVPVMGVKEIEISCLPTDLPETIVFDIANLIEGDKVTVAELSVPERVEILTDLDSIVVSVMAPTKEVVEEKEEAETPDGE
ncbi:MAG: 50S ribosomal protein L25 [Deltaproteobacteria bacterium]